MLLCAFLGVFQSRSMSVKVFFTIHLLCLFEQNNHYLYGSECVCLCVIVLVLVTVVIEVTLQVVMVLVVVVEVLKVM